MTNPEPETIVNIQDIDYVELYVGNSRQAAYLFCTAFGFTPLAYAGLETGLRDRMSYMVVQGTVRLVLTAPSGPSSAIAQHVNLQKAAQRAAVSSERGCMGLPYLKLLNEIKHGEAICRQTSCSLAIEKEYIIFH